jgi:hypothetical protein
VFNPPTKEVAMSQQTIEATIFWGLLMLALLTPWLMHV